MYYALGICMICNVFISNAQDGSGQVLDKVIAIVGREIVLQSDIEGRLAMIAQQNCTIIEANSQMEGNKKSK